MFIQFIINVKDKLIRGRPYGGVGLMWNKSLSHIVNIVKYDCNRILGIELTANQHTILLICCYLPYECDMNYDDYCFYLQVDKFKCIIESASTSYVCILGDFSANIQSQSIFGTELIEFCDMNNLCFTDRMMLLPDAFTFVSQAHDTTSWLDRSITTSTRQTFVADVSIINSAVCSDHLPLSVQITWDGIPLYDSNFVKKTRTIHKWHLASEEDKHKYYNCTHRLLSDIEIPIKALYCKDSNCANHNIGLESFYNQIVSAMKLATQKCIPTTKSSAKFKVIPGWNEYVKEHHDIARNALHLWTLTIDHATDQFITP